MNNKPISSPLQNSPIRFPEQRLALANLNAIPDKWDIINSYKQTNIFGHQNVLYVMQNNKTGELKSVEYPNKIF